MSGQDSFVWPWAMDFLRAARERPLWARLALPIVLGRFAFRELVGLQDALMRIGYSAYFPYGAGGASYHQEKGPRQWWVQREPPALPPPAPSAAPQPPVAATAPGPDLPAIQEFVEQHNTHTNHETQAMNKLGVLDGEFLALVNVALPQMMPEHVAQFHAWNFRRQLVIEEINEAMANRKGDLERLYTELNRRLGHV